MTEKDLRQLHSRLPEKPGLHRESPSTAFVVFVPLATIEGKLHLLFEKRAKGIRQEQEICFPGGKVEPDLDATVEETALRETEEELRIPRSRLSVIGRMDAVLTHWGGIIDVVVGTVDGEAALACRPNEQEVERTLLAPVGYFVDNPPDEYTIRVEYQPSYVDEAGNEHVLFPARELGLPERYWKPWPRPPHSVYAYRYDGETIWGITAGLTRRVIELLR